jgi:hypothetical protein
VSSDEVAGSFDPVTIWPVFLDRTMHEDTGSLFSVADTVSWDVILVDAEAEGWPAGRLVETDVRIEARPDFAVRGVLARTSELAVCWRGQDVVGSEFWIQAGLSVDLFNPPFRSTVTGLVTSIETVRSQMAQDRRGVWNPTGAWQLTAASRTPRWLSPCTADRACTQDLGFLIGLEVRSHKIQSFPAR